MAGSGDQIARSELPTPAAPPRMFSRKLPILGVLIGLSYLGVLFAAGYFTSPTSRDLQATYFHVTDANTDPCTAPEALLQPMPDGKVFIGYGPDPVRVLIRTEAMPDLRSAILYLDASVDRASFSACASDAKTPDQISGDRIAFSERLVKSEDMAFQILDTEGPASFALTMVQNAAISQRLLFESSDRFASDAQRRLMLRLFAYGALVIMILYNTLLALMARNGGFAFNAGITFSMLLLDMYLSGFGPAYVWPEMPQVSDKVLLAGLAGPTLFGPFYFIRFLKDDTSIGHVRAFDLVWPILSVVLILFNLAGFEIFSLVSLTASWIIMTAVYAARVLMRTRQNNELASVLLLPLFGAAIPAMIAGALNSWWQPDFGILQDHLAELAMVLESLTFTLALAFLLRISQWREHEALRLLNAQSVHAKRNLLSTIDADRTRMAAELHDTAGQGLLLAASRLKQPKLTSADIEDTAGIVNQTLNDLRNLSHDLHPATLEHLGLSSALDALVTNLRHTTPADIRFQNLNLADTFSAPASLHIYRIAQELLTNAVNHAKATEIVFDISQTAGEVILIVADNGVGIMQGSQTGGIGSTIIAERVEALSGTLMVDVDNGTRATVRFPISPNLLSEVP